MSDLHTFVILRASRRPHPRRFYATFYKEHGRTEIDGETYEYTTPARGRHAAVLIFRHYFAANPAEAWDDWYGIGASDGKGLVVYLDQQNNFDTYPTSRGLLLPEKCEAS